MRLINTIDHLTIEEIMAFVATDEFAWAVLQDPDLIADIAEWWDIAICD